MSLPGAVYLQDGPFTLAELMACVLAREIQPGDVGGIPGVRSEVPLAAVALAARLHAPDLVLHTVHGWGNASAVELTGTTSDWEVGLRGYAYYELSDIFDLLHSGALDWIFYGALQMDQYGNVNLVALGDPRHPRLRGPGTAGGSSENWAKRYFMWVNEHSPRVFVPLVDYVTVAGYGPDNLRSSYGPMGRGPSPIVTPLAVLDMDTIAGRMKLVSVHPGISVDEVTEKTGFRLIMPDTVPVTQAPSAQELAVLRTEIDPDGLLRRDAQYG